MEVVFRLSVHQLRPVARSRDIRILGSVDPRVGGHELKDQHDQRGSKADDRKDVDQAFIAVAVIIVVCLQGRRLRRRGKRSAERLGRSLELNGGFWQGDRRWSTATRSDRCGGCAGPSEADRRSSTHGSRGTGGAQRNRRCRCWRTWRATASGRCRRSSRHRWPDRRSHWHGGRRNRWRRIRRLQGDTDGFLFERHTRCLLAQWHARSLLGRGWLVFVIAHALAGFEILVGLSKATCPPAVKPPNRDFLKKKNASVCRPDDPDFRGLAASSNSGGRRYF